MGTRRQARECALKMLFQIDLSQCSPQEAQSVFWSNEPSDHDVREFANQLVLGVMQEKESIDPMIATHSTHWKIHRMAPVDKNILRLAVYELKHFPDIPLKVTLNEAIEIAKKYGTEESSSFINGVLDKIGKELKIESPPQVSDT